jgi:dienelactone hydrolase
MGPWELGTYPKGLENFPVGGLSWYEAAAYAAFAGKSLPTIWDWNKAADTRTSMLVSPVSNFGGHGPVPVGSLPDVNQYGTSDMAGNVKEWCWNEAEGGRRYILGGGWNEPTYMFVDQDAQSPWERAPAFGVRCVRYVSPGGRVAETARKVEPLFRDYSKEKPVSDEVFRAYRGLYAYDRAPLNAVVEGVDQTTDDWTRQRISLDAAYGNERLIVYLYLPRNAAAPYQTVVYFPWSNAIHMDRIGDTPSRYADLVPRSGRVLLFPIYKGTYERRDAFNSDYPAPTSFFRDHMIQWVKDLRRSLDYARTRPDLDHEKIAYMGLSWGGAVAPIMLALEDRFRAAVVLSGGFEFQSALPEVDQINFVSRVHAPVLMLNGRYDHFFPVETSQLPLFRLLGTPDADKRHVIYDTGHAPPRSEVIREAVGWLDRYLGPVTGRAP